MTARPAGSGDPTGDAAPGLTGAGLVAFAAVCFGTLGPVTRFADEAGVGSLALVAWRLLLNLGWLAAAGAAWVLFANRQHLFGGVRSVRAAARAFLVVLFAVSALCVVVLLPYWGLLGNLWGV